ncbi:MAG: hypothetical protein JXX14_12825 [Deltaproteobacteria bacterium]|nr:hypothetical protein [Deltaproteobacteria bacterium]
MPRIWAGLMTVLFILTPVADTIFEAVAQGTNANHLHATDIELTADTHHHSHQNQQDCPTTHSHSDCHCLCCPGHTTANTPADVALLPPACEVDIIAPHRRRSFLLPSGIRTGLFRPPQSPSLI